MWVPCQTLTLAISIMFITMLTDFQYVIDLPLFYTSEWQPVHQSINVFFCLPVALLPSIIPIFLYGAVETVHTATWPHCPNKNVYSNRLSWPYDSSHSLILGGRLFQTCGPAAAKVLSPKLLRVRLTTSVRVSAERSSDVGDQYMFITMLTDFHYVIDLPLFHTSEWQPVHQSINAIQQ